MKNFLKRLAQKVIYKIFNIFGYDDEDIEAFIDHNEEFFRTRAQTKLFNEIITDSKNITETKSDPEYQLLSKEKEPPFTSAKTKKRIENNLFEVEINTGLNTIYLPLPKEKKRKIKNNKKKKAIRPVKLTTKNLEKQWADQFNNVFDKEMEINEKD